MDKQLEKRLSDRAVEIGRKGDAQAFDELLKLLKSTSDNVRRLSASALAKLAWMGVDKGTAVAALSPIALRDPQPQTRQYAIKALKVYGADSRGCLADLKDMATNPAEKDYIRKTAASAVAFIEEAVGIAAQADQHHCQRCGDLVSADEFARSVQAFQRAFCDRCFDEVFLERRNFETQVEMNKTIEARDGTVVQSGGEKKIAEWLAIHGIVYRIEYWGLDTPQYKMSMYKKQLLYQQEGKRLISVHPHDLAGLDRLLASKLRLFGFNP